jgi:hypothetical protein
MDDLHVEDGRESRHAPAGERTTLELVLHDEDAFLRRSWRAATTVRSQCAPLEQRDGHARTMLAAALTAHKDQG